MRHLIDPLVDCVFKALLGDPDNTDILLSFLNAFLAPDEPLTDVQLVNPTVPGEFVGDDHRVLDVRARDLQGREIQVEVQLRVRPWMSSRVLYSWADLYQSQLQRGEHFRTLRPVVSIWVLAEDLLPRSSAWHHVFRAWDPVARVALSEHMVIHTVELQKWRPRGAPLASDDRWAYFLKEGHAWRDLPAAVRTPELEKAMSVLERFSDKAEDYHRYQSRMNFLREQAALAEEKVELEQEIATLRSDMDQIAAEKDMIAAEKDMIAAEKDAAIAHLRARLIAAGLDPDAG